MLSAATTIVMPSAIGYPMSAPVAASPGSEVTVSDSVVSTAGASRIVPAVRVVHAPNLRL